MDHRRHATLMLVMTLLVRDEQDILEANLEHHLAAGVDQFVVTDHRSTDATSEILERYRRLRVLESTREESPAYLQATWVTRMARRAHALGATWVINADADEFWWPRDASLRDGLMSVPYGQDVIVARRYDFPPVPDESGAFHDRMDLRELRSRNLLGQPLPPKVAHRAHQQIVVAQGNHSVSAPGLGRACDDGRVEIMHFPMRTFAQFERKIVNGGSAYEAPESPPIVGGTWRYAYREWRMGRLRDLYGQHVLAHERVSERLAAGEIVKDTRLADRLNALPGRAAVANPPAA
jgi:hypothetical protein